MIQLSCLLVGRNSEDFATPPTPLALAAHPDGTRITGRWDEASPEAARGDMADWLLAQGVDEAVDLFTGQPFRVTSWKEPVTLANFFSARHTELEGRLWARLFGLYALGESDIVVSAESDVPVAALYRFLSHYAAFRMEAARTGAEHRRDRPLPYGYWFVGFADADLADAEFWTLLREALFTQHLRHAFDERMQAPAPLFVTEAARLEGAMESFDLGISRACRYEDLQLLTARRWGVAGKVLAPSAHDAAGVCDRVEAALQTGAASAFAYREPSQGDIDSGWRFGCLDPDHRHDRDAFRILPLHRAVAAMPGCEAYLAMPAGTVLSFEDGAFWVQPPGDERSFRDDGDPVDGMA